ncbi:unnamed protein product [Owenia fusiformis]|uniref:DAGKc domain-containing protein n=1 Tax=Owenia fusiformis TaxID=6347 RepID=A0A8S4PZA8_OWEFU|nr:unnamed protein product [Owenia fusiformis]
MTESERPGASERSFEEHAFTCNFAGRQSTVSVGREKIDIVECADVKKPAKVAKSDHIILSDVLCAKVTGHSEVTVHVIQGTSKDKKLTLKQVKLSLNDTAQVDTLMKKTNDAIKAITEGVRPRKLLAIVNPIGGGQIGEKIYTTKAAPLFALAGIEILMKLSERPKHAIELARETDLKDFDGVVTVGGDGTFTEVCNGLIERNLKDGAPILPIGIIPAGTGNGMVNGFSGSYDVTAAVLTIIRGSTYKINALEVKSAGDVIYYGTMLFGLGFFGQVIHKAEKKRHLKKLRYPVTMLTGIKNLPSCRVELDVKYTNKDGEDLQPSDWTNVRGSFTSVSCLPAQHVDDEGYVTSSVRNPSMDLTFMPDATRMDMIRYFNDMRKHLMSGEDWVLREPMYSAPFRQVKIKAVDPENELARLLNVDGEPILLDNPEFEIRLLHKLLPIYSRSLLK